MAVLTGTRAKRDAWIEWLDHCLRSDGAWANPLFFGKVVGGVPVPWVDALRALEMAFQAGGYFPRSAWSYNFRGISGAVCTCSVYGKCSLHGSGIAIDIDPRLNPYISTSRFSWSATAFTPEQIALVEGIRNTKGEQVWFWGGRWRTIKDYMHFEANVDPGSADIDWSTVPGGGAQNGEEMLYGLDIGKVGESSKPDAPAHRVLQAFLVSQGFDLGAWGPHGDGVDGRPGDDTRKALHDWKISVGITSETSGGESVIGDYEMAAIYAAGAAAQVDVDLSDYPKKSEVYTRSQANKRFALVSQVSDLGGSFSDHVSDVRSDTPHS